MYCVVECDCISLPMAGRLFVCLFVCSDGFLCVDDLVEQVVGVVAHMQHELVHRVPQPLQRCVRRVAQRVRRVVQRLQRPVGEVGEQQRRGVGERVAAERHSLREHFCLEVR